MLKRLIFALVLAVQIGAVVSSVSAELPFPTCFPCPEDPPAR